MYNLVKIIGDRQAGFILGMVVVLNLIIGSFVMNNHPDLYPKFFHLNLNYFFQPVRVEHAWLYALLVTLSVFGINLLACIVESIIRMINNRSSRLKAIAALLFHIALAVTLVAHLYEGFFASTRQLPIMAQGMELPALGKVRIESLKNIYYPDNSLKDTEVRLLFSKPDGEQITKDIAFNEPAIFDAGRRQVVMLSGQTMPAGIVISRSTDKQEFSLKPGKPLSLENASLVLQGFYKTEDGLPVAQLLSQSSSGYQEHVMALEAGSPQSQVKINEEIYQFKEVIEVPFIVAIVRYNPAVPLMAVSLLLASIATFLLIKWIRNNPQ